VEFSLFRRKIMYRLPPPPWRRCAALTAAILGAWRDAASQSCTAARILPRPTAGSPGLAWPVISSSTRSPAAIERSRLRSISLHARSRLSPCRSTILSGSIPPERSRRSQVESSVSERTAVDRGAAGRLACPDGRGRCGSAWAALPGSFSGSRDSGRIVAATRAHSFSSSGPSERTRSRALGKQDERLARRGHPACQTPRLGACPPERVEPVRPLDRSACVLRHPYPPSLRTI
jgi:hypothetical protein